MVMEVDKVADEVADVDVDKVADMVVKITNEDFTHVILTIGDTFGDDVRGGAGGDGYGSSGRWEGRQKGCGIVKSNLEVKEIIHDYDLIEKKLQILVLL